MDDTEQLHNKTFVGNADDPHKKEKTNHVTKKCHVLDGKYFIVIDKSIVDKLYLSGDNNYFYQELTEDRAIVLRLFKMET